MWRWKQVFRFSDTPGTMVKANPIGQETTTTAFELVWSKKQLWRYVSAILKGYPTQKIYQSLHPKLY